MQTNNKDPLLIGQGLTDIDVTIIAPAMSESYIDQHFGSNNI